MLACMLPCVSACVRACVCVRIVVDLCCSLLCFVLFCCSVGSRCSVDDGSLLCVAVCRVFY